MFKLIIAATIAAGISWVASSEIHKRQRNRLMETMANDRAEAAEKTYWAAFKAGTKTTKDEYEKILADEAETHQKEVKELQDGYESRMGEIRANAYSEGYEKGKKARLQAATSYKKGYEDGKKDALEPKEEGRLKAV